MIDWTKPIETLGGRAARKITTVENNLWHYVFVPSENFGDVFLVNAEGFICGDRTNFGTKREPFIRNVRVKREGWVLMRPSSASMDGRYLADDRVYGSEAEAKSAKASWYNSDPGVEPVYLTWEENP
jgi:hypothetical protein